MVKRIHILLIVLLSLSGCSLIDDDLSVCGVDCRIDYQMRLQTNMRMTVTDKLHADSDKPLADSLANWLAPIFSAHAHDVELSFYSADDGLDELKHHSTEIVDDQSKTFTFYLPRENYRHLAVVNSMDNGQIVLRGKEHSATYEVATKDADTLQSQPTAIYTAREQINAAGEEDSYVFTVNLYMASSAVALVLYDGVDAMQHIEVYLNGTASGLSVGDSVYTFSNSCPVRCEQVTERCYAAVSLPSRGKESALAGAPKRTGEVADNYWQLDAFVTLPDGTITETKLDIDYPLAADALEIIKCSVQDDGSLVPIENAHIGATVLLDWKSGGEHVIDI
ncbi:MAG: hypothetical protein IJT12_02210 [Paludibacteraceae bacterium]|nr:hypothetical protein [Paludibacteraceae bacterium]